MLSKKGIALGVLVALGVLLITGCRDNSPDNNVYFLGPEELTSQLTVGTPFSRQFCQPESAASGATCGGLAGDTIDPSGGNPPYSFVVEPSTSGGLLPPGLALNLNGLLEGTPALEGYYDFNVCAKDLHGNNNCRYMVFQVNGEDQTPSAKSLEDTTVEDTAKSGEQSMTYQIDVDAILNYVGTPEYDRGYNGYDEHIVFSTQKTIIRKYEREKFEAGWYDVKHPIQVSIEGYSDASCMKGGEIHKVRGTYSSQVYDGTFNIYMSYHDEKSSDNPADHGLWIFFSQIEGLPRLEEKGLTCIPSPSDVGETVLASKVNGLLDAASSVGTQMENIATNMEGGPIFKSVEGGVLDISGPIMVDNGRGEALKGYAWSGSVAVKRIS